MSGAQTHAQDVRLDTLRALLVTTPVPGSKVVPNDFNGDGLSDLLWYNTITSQMAYWIMSTDASGAVTRSSYRIFNITPGYFIGASGNFNGDGFADVVFTSASHDLYLWTNDGQGGFRSTSLGSYPTGWQLVGAGDVDGDGQDDLLWMNSGNCQFAYWLMKNGTRVGSKTLPVTCGSYPLSIGYYSLSNRLSIVWSSAGHDLSFWDFTADGANVNTFGNYGVGGAFLAFGGGYAGGNMSYIVSDGSGGAYAQSLERAFFINGKQDTSVVTTAWSGGMQADVAAGGFLIEGRQINKTGIIYKRGNTGIGICPPESGSTFSSGPTASPGSCVAFSFPAGWFLIGANNGAMP